MDDALSTKLTKLCSRDKDILRNCVRSGVLELYAKALHPIRGVLCIEELIESFSIFICEKEYVQIPPRAHRDFMSQFGRNVQYHRASGIVMVLRDKTPCHFTQEDKIFERKDDKKSNSLVFHSIGGADVPSQSRVFAVGLKSQLPSRGLPTPDANLRRRSTDRM